ncbi:hypothetical protein ACSHWB_14800 [Lentzea sp. HUAS TT2]|uniref:hypothetical protein n=1 Tax=Lentzea sp. HUAS TT2 TaxID=3447454 RepID=UPI003F6E6890
MAGGKRSNGEGSVYQRKDGLWVGAAYVLTTTGHRKRVTVSATTESEAWKKLRKKIADSDAGIPVAAETWTLESYLKYWLSTVAATKRPRTVEGYGVVVRRHLVPNLGTKKLHRLSAQDVRTFITRPGMTAGAARKRSTPTGRRMLVVAAPMGSAARRFYPTGPFNRFTRCCGMRWRTPCGRRSFRGTSPGSFRSGRLGTT